MARIEASANQQLRITTDSNCANCSGTGLWIRQAQLSDSWKQANTLTVAIRVCNCVKLEYKPKQPNQFTKKEKNHGSEGKAF